MKNIVRIIAVILFSFICCTENPKFEIITPTLMLSPSNNIHFTAQAKESEFVIVEVTTTNKDWSIEVNQNWCKIQKNDMDFIVSAKPNTELSSPPKATIQVTAGILKQQIYVTQDAATSTLSISPSKKTISATGGLVSAFISSNTNWRVSSNQSWATPNINSGKGDQQILISVKANTTTAQDEAIITISTDSGKATKLIITRQATTGTLSISPQKETISAIGGSISAFILSNTEWHVFSNQDWAIPNVNTGYNNSELVITILPNKSSLTEYATVIIYSETENATLTIAREAGPVYCIGDYYPNPNSPSNAIGIVFSLDNPINVNGTNVSRHGKILAVSAAKGYFWFDKVYGFPWVLTNANSKTNGLVNVEAVKAVNSGNLTGYAAFAYCKRKTDGGLYWYLPAIDELKVAFTNRNLINPKIKTLGGIDLNVDQISSTEHSEKTMYYMRRIGDSWTDMKTVTNFYTRPVATF